MLNMICLVLSHYFKRLQMMCLTTSVYNRTWFRKSLGYMEDSWSVQLLTSVGIGGQVKLAVVFMHPRKLPRKVLGHLGTFFVWSVVLRDAFRPPFSPAVRLRLQILLGVTFFERSQSALPFNLSLPVTDSYHAKILLILAFLHWLLLFPFQRVQHVVYSWACFCSAF